MKYIGYYSSPLGQLTIVEENDAVTHILFADSKGLPDCMPKETPVIKMAKKELSEYFEGKRTTFSTPIQLHGTTFQKAVWNALLTIPFGEIRSYKDIAVQAGNPKAARAVGMANNKNPIPIIVPCHRVIGANGSLVGYAGGLDIKTYLLELEKNHA